MSFFTDEADQSFLVTNGHELLRIDSKAEYAKEQICKAIDQKAEDAKGKIIYEIQERFKNDPKLKGGLLRYFHSLGYWDNASMTKMGLEKPENSTSMTAAFKWANAYRAALEMHEKLAGSLSPSEIQSRAAALSKTALARIYTSCSEKDRNNLYQEIAEGRQISAADANEISKSPEIKLSKAEELLAAARIRKQQAEERWEEVKADPEITPKSSEYTQAVDNSLHAAESVENWEQKISELQAQVEAKEAELNKYKYDQDLQRQTRIKLLTDALTIGVPQATADLNKYMKDAEYYDPDTRRHFDDQIKVLADMCGDYLSRI
ncbi:hypothetical protein [Synechococcus sp. BIOS-U3-1]|uniref:hypothetical protein n=1 Tax=Synechococcus sp. BIOS-U3-1 TaxID=1400865 RepID=UPI0016453ECA|nr:hypothetical protein [Synechococcus sp. BIOS-U3-1]